MNRHESLARTIGIAIVCCVAVILAVSFIGYVGEHLVAVAHSMHKVKP